MVHKSFGMRAITVQVHLGQLPHSDLPLHLDPLLHSGRPARLDPLLHSDLSLPRQPAGFFLLLRSPGPFF